MVNKWLKFPNSTRKSPKSWTNSRAAANAERSAFRSQAPLEGLEFAIAACARTPSAPGSSTGFRSGGEPDLDTGTTGVFQSSAIVARGFCANCGTPHMREDGDDNFELASGHLMNLPALVPSSNRSAWKAAFHGSRTCISCPSKPPPKHARRKTSPS